MLWYVFSLTFCLASTVFLYIFMNAALIQNTPLSGAPGKAITMLVGASMDVREELLLLAALGGLLILPQILSYLMGGIFGCGSPPAFVAMVTNFVMWSLIKFFCVLSGILAAQSIFALYGHPYLAPKDSPRKFAEALLMIDASFAILAVEVNAHRIEALIAANANLNWMERAHRFMTRYHGNRTTELETTSAPPDRTTASISDR